MSIVQCLPPTYQCRREIVLCEFHKNLQYHVIASIPLQCLPMKWGWIEFLWNVEYRVKIMLEHVGQKKNLLFAVSLAFLLFILRDEVYVLFNIDNLLSKVRHNKKKTTTAQSANHYVQQQWRRGKNSAKKKIRMRLLIFTYQIRLNIVPHIYGIDCFRSACPGMVQDVAK